MKKKKVVRRKTSEVEAKPKPPSIAAAEDLKHRIATRKGCPHTRYDGTSNIKWMEHSNHIIKGVCGSCFSEFDASNSDDLHLFLLNAPDNLRNMGQAVVLPGTVPYRQIIFPRVELPRVFEPPVLEPSLWTRFWNWWYGVK